MVLRVVWGAIVGQPGSPLEDDAKRRAICVRLVAVISGHDSVLAVLRFRVRPRLVSHSQADSALSIPANGARTERNN